MVKANRSFQEWAAMSHKQRQDFIKRYNKYTEEQEKIRKKQEQQIEQSFNRKY